eukprot:Rhum_TRINITY_DN23714_c0_g1::Rhum_TRINITY_DN23714_c0_g1_i1::g.178617::m.178617
MRVSRTLLNHTMSAAKAATRVRPMPPCTPTGGGTHVSILPPGTFAGMLQDESLRDDVHQHHRVLARKNQSTLLKLSYGYVDEATQQCAEVLEALRALPEHVLAPAPNRDGRTSQLIQGYIAIAAQVCFYEQGVLLSKRAAEEALGPRVQVEDQEYLIGVIGFVEELAAYGLRRAAQKDVLSVAASRDVAQRFLELMMEFNFRNDQLRRSYDSVKWNVRRLNELLYDLSAASPHAYAAQGTSGILDNPGCIDEAELGEIRERVEEFDRTRELVLQGARGKAQKLAKHAIFSLHRGDAAKGKAQIDEAVAVARETYEQHIEGRYPTLRGGAFGDCMEEIAEAYIFWGWLETGSVPVPGDVVGDLMQLDEYLGGLMDFTGEVGRVAVLHATNRDAAKVGECFAVVLQVTEELNLCPSLPRLGRKRDALKGTLKKLEQLVFDLSKKA